MAPARPVPTRRIVGHRAGTIPSKERRDKLARQRRQLEKRGRVTLRSARTCAEIRDAAELFLALEESGWKGARRTALLSDGSRAASARMMTRRLAREGKCRIDALMLDDRPIAEAARAELKRAVEIKAGFYRDALPHSQVLSAAKKTRRSAHGKGA
jgi:Acetyltransferase (GNAT) domain